MSYPVLRAEQALIGAMLTDQPLPEVLDHLELSDFLHPAYSVAFSQISNLRTEQPYLLGDALVNTATVRINDAKTADPRYAEDDPVSATQLATLRDDCPTPANVGQYAHMVVAAGFQREAASHADRIINIATQGSADPAMWLMADTLARHVYSMPDSPRMSTQQPRFRVMPTVTEPAITTVPENAETRELAVLAASLHDPAWAQTLATSTPPGTVFSDVFTSPAHRDVYGEIVLMHLTGQSVDEVTVAWNIHTRHHIDSMVHWKSDLVQPVPGTYLARLAHTDVPPDVAKACAQQLVTDHFGNKTAPTTPQTSIEARPGTDLHSSHRIAPTAPAPIPPPVQPTNQGPQPTI